MSRNRYQPRASQVRKITPGDILYEWVECGELTVQKIAEELGVSIYHALCLLDGRVRITPMVAGKLSHLTQCTTQFWLNLQRQHDEALTERWSRRKMR